MELLLVISLLISMLIYYFPGCLQDIILGDFGFYDASLPYPQYQSLTDYAAYAGGDTLVGGNDDDVLIGQEVSAVATALCLSKRLDPTPFCLVKPGQ